VVAGVPVAVEMVDSLDTPDVWTPSRDSESAFPKRQITRRAT